MVLYTRKLLFLHWPSLLSCSCVVLCLTDLIAGNEASGNFFSTFSSKYLHLLFYWRPGSGQPYKVTPLMISSKHTVNSV